MPATPTRSTRIEARVAPETLGVIRRAAEIQGRSVSDFVVTAAREAAEKAIGEAQIIRLSVEDQRALADALLNPPAPAPGLLDAVEDYRRMITKPR